jgi:hypothetical protein
VASTWIASVAAATLGDWGTYHDFHDALVISVPVERVGMLLSVNQDPLPSQLLDLDMDLVDVGILGRKERPDVQRKLLRIENMGRDLCQVYQRNVSQGRVNRKFAHST